MLAPKTHPPGNAGRLPGPSQPSGLFSLLLPQSLLSLTRVIDRLGEDARSFLGRVKTRQVLRPDKVQKELRAALKLERSRELFVNGSRGARCSAQPAQT